MHTTDQLNTTLSGRYAIDRLIGEGGMATVYLARDVKHNRRVALKVLKPDLGAVVGVERFLSEIQVTANLQHPNLLPLFDSGAADSLLFYVMPYVEGESLRARIQREKQLPVEEAVRLATAIASALDYAHRHGVIHRDLKPENILLNEGQPLVADFGIALAVSNAGGNRITQTGLSLGTPQYMSPEQATGDRVIDARTDIYSLGALTYEMLTGEPPHMGSTSQAVIARVLTERPRGIRLSRPSVPEQIEAAVERALEKLPADRWATAREMSEALTGARIVTRSTFAGMTGVTVSQSRRPAWREIAAWTLAAGATASAVLLAMQAARPAPPAVPVEFQVELPDSLDPTPRGSAAGLALSRDGSTLVFQATHGRAVPALYVRRLGERDVQKIRGTDSSRAPYLSPDGSELVFVGGITGQGTPSLERIAVRGGTARRLSDSVGGAPASWSGGRVVFPIGNRIATLPAEGGAVTPLASPDSGLGHARYSFPDVIPGGHAALISISKGTGSDSMFLGLVTIPGGDVTELGIRGMMPRYSGTGHILYVTTEGFLFAAPFDARKLRVTGPAFPVAENVRFGGGGAATYAVADNGTLAYMTGGLAEGRPLVIVSRNGAERPLGPTLTFPAGPRVSPDGRQVAVSSASRVAITYPNPDIWRLDTTSKALVRVTTDSSSWRPEWSRDGERLIYVSRRDTAAVARPLYSSGQATLYLRSSSVVVSIAPGRARGYSAFKVSEGTNKSDDIWIVHADSMDTPHPFLTEAYEEQSPTVSPDGKLLAYATNRTGRFEVYVRPVSGSGAEVQVTADGGTEPVWARDGSELFYRTETFLMSARLNASPKLSLVRRDTLFVDAHPRNAEHANYDVFPGGQHFVFIGATRGPENSPIIIRTNWHVRRASP
ncbi:MAG: protein kinase domain-containing protein [Gemmatimonadaceae bacterium]